MLVKEVLELCLDLMLGIGLGVSISVVLKVEFKVGLMPLCLPEAGGTPQVWMEKYILCEMTGSLTVPSFWEPV